MHEVTASSLTMDSSQKQLLRHAQVEGGSDGYAKLMKPTSCPGLRYYSGVIVLRMLTMIVIPRGWCLGEPLLLSLHFSLAFTFVLFCFAFDERRLQAL